MDLQFISMSLKNVMSYGNVESFVPLDNIGTTIITGRNVDQQASSGITVNGIGKTTILLALMFGLYDETIYKITKDNMVNNINDKGMEIKVVFRKNDDLYMVHKARKMKAGAGGNYTILYKNGVKVDCNDPAKEVQQVLEIPFEIFSRMIMFSAKSQSFFDLPPTTGSVCQTGIIESLFDLNMLTEKAEKLKASTKQLDKDKTSEEHKISLVTQQIALHSKQIEQITTKISQWEQNTEQSIQNLEQQIALISSIDIDEQMELYTINQQSKQALNSLQNNHRECKNKITTIGAAIVKLEDQIAKLETNTCPFCLQHMANAADKISEAEQSIDEMSTEIEQYVIKMNKYSADINDIQESINECTQKMIADINISKLSEMNANRAGILSKLEQLSLQDNPYIEQLEELKQQVLPEPDLSSLNKIEENIFHANFLIKTLTKKDSFIRKALLHKNLTYLNTRLGFYANELGLPHKVKFSEDMTPKILIRGKELGYGNLSSGQKSRLNLALSLAFRDVLQRKYGSINLFIFDEVLDDGLDALGIFNAIKMLKNLAKDHNLSIYIISHREDALEQFDNKVIIEMTNGFSRVINSEPYTYRINTE